MALVRSGSKRQGTPERRGLSTLRFLKSAPSSGHALPLGGVRVVAGEIGFDCRESIAGVPGFSLFLMEHVMHIQQGLNSLFLGEVGVLFCIGLQGTLRWAMQETGVEL